nr:hypothetical protein 29 [Moraxellaceae bacterium]BDD46578.1 hypothetical protein 5 [Moraxellaceae bacterium]
MNLPILQSEVKTMSSDKLDPIDYVDSESLAESIKVGREIIEKLTSNEELSYTDQCVLFITFLASKDAPPLSRSVLKPIIGNTELWSKIQNELVGMYNNAKDNGSITDELFNAEFQSQISNVLKESKQKRKDREKTYIVRKLGTNEIKIGKSINVAERIKTLSMQAGYHLVVLKIIDKNIEFKLHKKFAHLRTIGEWFNDENGEICEFVETLTSNEVTA